jgi:hypothetical protein
MGEIGLIGLIRRINPSDPTDRFDRSDRSRARSRATSAIFFFPAAATQRTANDIPVIDGRCLLEKLI